jgi:hypothetical protein
MPADDRNAQAWKRQVAVFGGAVSALVGIGILLVVFFTSRDAAHKHPTPAPAPPSGQIQN